MNTTIADLRKDYTQQALTEQDIAPNPIAQFHHWFEQALAAQVLEPNAMTLATATLEGKPSARIVLLKQVSEQGFIFFTNYESHKGRELIANPWAALTFWWAELERQVRIEGTVHQTDPLNSDEYFQSRPRESQLGAWVSPQSQVIADRSVLEDLWQDLSRRYENQPIPRPPHWGGFCLNPSVIEFWQGRPSRLHDRLSYRRHNQHNWLVERLAP